MSKLNLFSTYKKGIFTKLHFTAFFNSIRNNSNWIPEDPVTHTGQKWDCDDYRLVRYINKTKHVNPNFAINLVEEVPPKACTERVVWCDGGGGPLGHPKVYINLDKPGCQACGYCGLRFYLDSTH